MNTILNKQQMTEEDIKLQYITSAITSKWDIKKATMETQITDGKINLKGNFVFREKPKRADYVLYMTANHPIAIILLPFLEVVRNDTAGIESKYYAASYSGQAGSATPRRRHR